MKKLKAAKLAAKADRLYAKAGRQADRGNVEGSIQTLVKVRRLDAHLTQPELLSPAGTAQPSRGRVLLRHPGHPPDIEAELRHHEFIGQENQASSLPVPAFCIANFAVNRAD